MAKRPVWHNRDVPLYVVNVAVSAERKHTILVLTQGGPDIAKSLAESAFSLLGPARAVGYQVIPHPLISPDLGDVEGAISSANHRHSSTAARDLTLYQVQLTGRDRGDLTCLIWSKLGAKGARKFAETSFAGSTANRVNAVGHPIIVAAGQEEAIVANG